MREFNWHNITESFLRRLLAVTMQCFFILTWHLVVLCYQITSVLLIFSLFISEGDPDNFLTYFKRATVLLAMGRSKSALPDLDRVLELRPDFFQV